MQTDGTETACLMGRNSAVPEHVNPPTVTYKGTCLFPQFHTVRLLKKYGTRQCMPQKI
jgi:hypothetical protein